MILDNNIFMSSSCVRKILFIVTIMVVPIPIFCGKNVILDLGRVLFDINETIMSQQTGIMNSARYLFQNISSIFNPRAAIRERFFTFLNSIESDEGNPISATDERGTKLPPIMCSWLKGSITHEQMMSTIETALNNPELVRNEEEKKLIHALTHTIFTPKILVTAFQINPDAAEFVEQCKAEGHNVYILSNFNASSFEQLKEKFPHFFKQFDGAIISGETKLLKPDKKIYQLLLEKHKLRPDECFLIDSHPENTATAQQLGIQSSLCTRKQSLLWGERTNFDQIHREMLAWEKGS